MAHIKLYSIFHKPFYQPSADFVIPIQGGKAVAAEKLDMLGDDTDENISALNPFYSELTAIYWIVINAERNCDGFGLCHYRRYFMKPKFNLLFKKKSDYSFKPSPKKIDRIVNKGLYKRIDQLLKDHDAIVQQPKRIHKKKGVVKNLEENYTDFHDQKDWEILKKVLFEKYPEYKNSWEAFRTMERMSFYNMMIAKWKVWDEYADWIFDILFEVQKRTRFSEDAYQKRVLGFMAERFMNLFLLHNKIKTAYLPVAVFDKS